MRKSVLESFTFIYIELSLNFKRKSFLKHSIFWRSSCLKSSSLAGFLFIIPQFSRVLFIRTLYLLKEFFDRIVQFERQSYLECSIVKGCTFQNPVFHSKILPRFAYFCSNLSFEMDSNLQLEKEILRRMLYFEGNPYLESFIYKELLPRILFFVRNSYL